MRVFTETNEQVLEKWDAGNPVSVIEMGGLGPGYEQCIQIVALELLRRLKDDPYVAAMLAADGELPDEGKGDFTARLNGTVSEIDNERDLGLSGAQAGVAQGEAMMWLRYGYAKAMNKAKEQGIEDDRFILVSKAFPSADPIKKELPNEQHV